MLKKLFIYHAFLLLLHCHSLAQNVGVGTPSPHATALLHVDHGSSTSKGLLVTGIYNPVSLFPNLGPGPRLMYYPGKAAFRVGNVAGTHWDNLNTGLNSFAAGFNTIASGEFSTAFGSNTTASGPYAAASGSGSVASGQTSTALGYMNTASGLASTSMGFFSIAKGYASTVTGLYNDPILLSDETSVSATTPLFIIGNGDNINRSNAMVVRKDGNVGIGTSIPLALVHIDLEASQSNGLLVTGTHNNNATIPSLGSGSRMMFYPGKSAFRAGHAQGSQWDNNNTGYYSTAMGISTKASGNYSMALNLETTASGDASTALGSLTIASANFAVAMGSNTSALGGTSLATGFSSEARGTFSSTFGDRTKAKGYASMVVGMHNDPILVSDESAAASSTTPLFIVGNGNPGSPSNAMVVRKDGNVGIGTSAPGYLLDVAGRMRIRSTGGAFTAGMYFNKGDNSTEGSFIGMNSDDHVGFYGIPLNNWGFLMNTANGYVGIGNNPAPQARLHVIRGVKTTGPVHSTAAAIFDGDQGGWIQLSNNSNLEGGILSGNQQTAIRSGIIFGTDSSLQLRTGGNLSRLIIDKTGDANILHDANISGNAIVTREVRRPATGTANLVPICYGAVGAGGNILTGSGNFTVNKPPSSLGTYEIVIDAHTITNVGYVSNATPVGALLPGELRSIYVNGNGGSLYVAIRDGFSLGVDCSFNFIVFKP